MAEDEVQTENIDHFIDSLSKKSMPALATTVHKMGQLTSAEDSRVSQLTEQVLKDPTLTTRVLQVANSVIYRGLTGQVNTITRAIVLMGFTTIRDICVSMKILDEMLKKSPTQHLKNVMAKSFHAAMQARGMIHKVKSGVREEIFISSLLHHLGEMSVLSRDDDLSRKLDYLISKKGLSPDQAAKEVLGFSFQDLTLGLANSWCLSDMMRQAVRPPKNISRPVEAVLLGEELSQVAGLGWDSEPVIEVVDRIADFAGLKPEDALEQAKQVADYARDVASHYGADAVKHLIPPSNYTVDTAARLNIITFEEQPEQAELPKKVMVELDITPEMIDAALRKVPLPSMEKLNKQAEEAALKKERQQPAQEIIGKPVVVAETGVVAAPVADKVDSTLHLEYMHKIGDMLAGKKVNVNQMFVLILEAMHSALGLERVSMALLAKDRKTLTAKLFDGEVSEQFKNGFSFKVDTENAFSYALGQAQPLWIGNEKTPGKEYLITNPIVDTLGQGGFFIAPIVVSRKPIGVFYGDQRNSSMPLTDQQFINFSMLAQQASIALSMMKE
ncbi:hypothetical protein A9Q99_26640 [Gammaproteobacteria bacterium 45_16_T64]|nr:hypothetical protein A9Q99_26640 [Gammaproteobacteria bacterium 45_16_T64]